MITESQDLVKTTVVISDKCEIFDFWLQTDVINKN